jgi:hypothetical protein
VSEREVEAREFEVPEKPSQGTPRASGILPERSTYIHACIACYWDMPCVMTDIHVSWFSHSHGDRNSVEEDTPTSPIKLLLVVRFSRAEASTCRREGHLDGPVSQKLEVVTDSDGYELSS